MTTHSNGLYALFVLAMAAGCSTGGTGVGDDAGPETSPGDAANARQDATAHS
ncbi:MAG: hypothetical protein KC416_13530 [Myxococcales bacterium]|nr:hypothetical protein [Myxococcales bacterium]